MTVFDPYTEWLGLPPGPRPPDAYALLGLRRFEEDAAKIEAAADESIRLIRRRASVERDAESRRLLQEVLAARCLLADPNRRRRYDDSLRRAGSSRKARRGIAGLSSPTVRSRVLSGLTFAAAVLAAAALLNVAWPPRRTADVRVAEAPPAVSVIAAAADVPEEAPKAESPAEAMSDEASPDEASTAEASSVDESPAKPSEPIVVGFPRPVVPVTREAVAAVPAGEESEPVVSTVRPEEAAPVEAPKPPDPAWDEYRVGWPDDPAARTAFGRQVRDLLYEAFELKAGEAGLLRRFRSARAAAPDAPLAEYALALVAWKRLRFDEAEARLAAASGPDATPFLPARRALLRLRLDRGRRDDALRGAVELAGVLRDAEGDVPSREARLATAAWLGRVLAALESPWTPEAAPPADVREAHAAVRAALGPDLLAGYESGRRSLAEDYAARLAEVEDEIARLTPGHRDRKAQELDRIAGSRDATLERKDEVARSSAEWKKWLDERLAAIDGELSRLDVAYRTAASQAETAWASVATLNTEIARRELSGQTDSRTIGPRGLRADFSGLVATRDQALTRYNLASGQATEARNRARALLAERAAAVARYEAATKTLVAETDSLRRWEGILKKRADETAAAGEEPPAAKALRRRLTRFDAYVPFDPASERNRVVEAITENRTEN